METNTTTINGELPEFWEEKLDRGFDGVFIPTSAIKKFGIKNAFLISSFLSGAPNLTKSQIRKAKKIINPTKKDPEYIKNYLLNNIGNYKCGWCEERCFCLNEHHYPIPKKDGGTHVVKICGKCHNDYHYLEELKLI